MAGELIVCKNTEAAFAPQYFGTIEYYAMSAAYGKIYIDVDMPADKRFKSTHRCRIIDTRDEINLTVPVSHPHGRHSWSETPVSSHGHWWHVHLTALESSYGRTPFFEYYIDKFSNIFKRNYETESLTVGELDRLCDITVREILGTDNEVVYGSPDTRPAADYRDVKIFEAVTPEYYQLRSDRLGFRSGLSILDLIFNMGQESAMIIKQVQDKAFNKLKTQSTI